MKGEPASVWRGLGCRWGAGKSTSLLYISGAAESPWVNKAPASCQVLNLCSKKSFLNKQREILLFAVLLREVLGIGRSRSWWQAKLCCSTEQRSSSAERVNAAAGQWSSLPGCHALLCFCIQDFSVLQAGGQGAEGQKSLTPAAIQLNLWRWVPVLG